MPSESVLTLLIGLCILATLVCWLGSLMTRNCSQVDRLWSILPPLYIGCIAVSAGLRDPRLGLMFGLTVLWGTRLTYNFARKGGYRAGSEDYRWPALRKRLGPVKFQIFNATFIAPFQNTLLLGLAIPAYVVFVQRQSPAGAAALGVLDAVAALGFLLLLLGETIADRQQWDFHVRKAAALAAGKAVSPPFLDTGLFRYSRHPNFFCEQGMWWCIYLFSVAATGRWFNPSIAGPIVLTLLFQGSTAFTEELSVAKYPDYADYQRRVSRLWPMPPRRPSLPNSVRPRCWSSRPWSP